MNDASHDMHPQAYVYGHTINWTPTQFTISFAQWQYRSLWGPTEARLLLIENLPQYPAMTTWNTVGVAIFGDRSGGRFEKTKPIIYKHDSITT